MLTLKLKYYIAQTRFTKVRDLSFFNVGLKCTLTNVIQNRTANKANGNPALLTHQAV